MTRYATHFEGIGPWDPLAMRILPPVYLHEFLKMYVLQHLRCMEELHTRSNSPFNCRIHQRRILQRRRNDFDLSMCEIELFIALQYVEDCTALITHFIFITMKLTTFRYFQKKIHVLD